MFSPRRCDVNPYSVILLDEIEKAHPDVFNLLLQVLEDGILTDSFGRNVDFKNTVLIMTSNVGSRKGQQSKAMGFESDNFEGRCTPGSSSRNINEDLKKTFSPEFLNRIDDLITFNPLARDQMYEILDIMLKDMNERLVSLDISFEYTEDAREFLVRVGFDPEQGARPLRRAIQRYVEDPLSERLLRREIRAGSHLLIDSGPDGLTFQAKERGGQPETAPSTN